MVRIIILSLMSSLMIACSGGEPATVVGTSDRACRNAQGVDIPCQEPITILGN